MIPPDSRSGCSSIRPNQRAVSRSASHSARRSKVRPAGLEPAGWLSGVAIPSGLAPPLDAQSSTPGWTRTSDPGIRNPMLYPPELRARVLSGHFLPQGRGERKKGAQSVACGMGCSGGPYSLACAAGLDEEGIRIAALTKPAAILESTAEICICRAKQYLDAVLFVLELPVGRSSKSTRTIPA